MYELVKPFMYVCVCLYIRSSRAVLLLKVRFDLMTWTDLPKGGRGALLLIYLKKKSNNNKRDLLTH